uniref:Cathepsin propeptide inhibitor domain-containing protein n=1 Tax=Anopheles farauti TaxID=69004 RepID=A0A182Q7V6_9DIPT
MNIRAGRLVPWVTVVVAFAAASGGMSPLQRNRLASGQVRRGQGRLSPSKSTWILQSAGSEPGVQGTAQEIVTAMEKAPPSPASVLPVASVTDGTTAKIDNTTIETTTESDLFRSYMQTHHKKYYAQYRTQRRRSAYMDNLADIKEHNKAYETGSNRFRMAPNAFADMQNSEYRKRLIRLKMDPHRKISPSMSSEIVSSTNEMPEAIDWREKGFKTEPANQKTCGSCYAFSVAYAISAQLMKHIGRVELVSEQQMVDCSTANGNLGCGGGSLRNTLKYLEQAGGVMREVDYPYTSSSPRAARFGVSRLWPQHQNRTETEPTNATNGFRLTTTARVSMRTAGGRQPWPTDLSLPLARFDAFSGRQRVTRACAQTNWRDEEALNGPTDCRTGWARPRYRDGFPNLSRPSQHSLARSLR